MWQQHQLFEHNRHNCIHLNHIRVVGEVSVVPRKLKLKLSAWLDSTRGKWAKHVFIFMTKNENLNSRSPLLQLFLLLMFFQPYLTVFLAHSGIAPIRTKLKTWVTGSKATTFPEEDQTKIIVSKDCLASLQNRLVLVRCHAVNARNWTVYDFYPPRDLRFNWAISIDQEGPRGAVKRKQQEIFYDLTWTDIKTRQ